MTTKRILMAGLCGAMLVGVNADAQERGPRGPRGDGEGRERPPLTEIIQRHDTNGDGILQSSEIPERFPPQIMERLDTNKDGSLSMEEAKVAEEMRGRRGEGDRPERGRRGPDGDRPQRNADGDRPERGPRAEGPPPERGGDNFGAIVEQFDVNGDGALQLDEAPDRMTRMFSRMDRNGDGTVDKHEAALSRERSDGPPRGDRKRPDGARAGRSGDKSGLEMIISRNDANKDGQLDKSEMPERMVAHFDRFDANGDGVISAEDATSKRGEGRPEKPRRGKPGVEQVPPTPED